MSVYDNYVASLWKIQFGTNTGAISLYIVQVGRGIYTPATIVIGLLLSGGGYSFSYHQSYLRKLNLQLWPAVHPLILAKI